MILNGISLTEIKSVKHLWQILECIFADLVEVRETVVWLDIFSVDLFLSAVLLQSIRNVPIVEMNKGNILGSVTLIISPQLNVPMPTSSPTMGGADDHLQQGIACSFFMRTAQGLTTWLPKPICKFDCLLKLCAR